MESSLSEMQRSTVLYIMADSLYTYKAHVIRVVDGDTVDLSIKLGFTVVVEQRVRLLGINAPEKNTQTGILSKKFLEALLPVGQEVIVRSEKPGGGDKYGRYLAEIFPVDIQDGIAAGSVNASLVSSGHAFAWDGTGAKPVA